MVTRSRTRRSKKSGISLNLSDYDPEGADFSGSGGFHIPEGDYAMKVKSVEQKTSSSDNEMLEWIFTGTQGKAKGKDFYLYTLLDEPQKLGKTLEACGVDFEPGEFDFDPDDVEGAEVIGEVYTDEYNGQERSKLRKVMSPDAAGEEEEEEETTTRGRRARKAKPNGRARSRVKLSEDEVKGMDEEELEDLLGKHDLEVDLAKAKTLSKKRNAVIEALTEADLIEA